MKIGKYILSLQKRRAFAHSKEYKGRLLKAVDSDLFADVDGFQKFWPKGPGFLDAEHLRIIADELDRRNAAWEKRIEEELSK